MVFIKPTDVSFVEMIGYRDNSFAFELGWLPGMDEVASSIAALFTLACEIGANLVRHNLWKNTRWVDGWILEIKHTHIRPLFGGCVDLQASFRLFLLLTIGGIGVVGRIRRSSRVALVSPALFRTRLGIGSRFTILPATDLSVVPRTDVVGRNGGLRNGDGEHGSLMKVDLIAKSFHDR
jgi:hypothetical protein